MVKAKAKPKAPKSSAKIQEASVLEKILERLEALEQKIDALQIQRRPESRPQSAPKPHTPAHHQAQHAHPQHSQPRPRTHLPSQPNYNRVQPSHNSNFQQSRPQNQGRRERQLFQAVCAECGTGCEVPFKPTGERPTYCKECFSKRKKGNPKPPAPVQTHSHAHAPAPAHTPRPVSQVQFPQRTVKVIPSGGRITITDMTANAAAVAQAPAPRAKAKPQKSPKKSR